MHGLVEQPFLMGVIDLFTGTPRQCACNQHCPLDSTLSHSAFVFYGTFLCSVFILLSTLVDLEMQMVVVNDLSCCQSRSLCDCLRCRTPLLDTNKLKTEWVAYTCTICYQALRRPFIVIFCSSKARFACTPNAVTRRSNHGCGSHG